MQFYTSTAIHPATIQPNLIVVEAVCSAAFHHLQQKASAIQKLVLSKSQLFEHGFPIEQGSQAYIQPGRFEEDIELFYTRFDDSRVCCRCGGEFYVDEDGCQPIFTSSAICQNSDGTPYNFHIHTQLPIEHLRQFKKAPKADVDNKDRSGKLFALDVESVYTSHGQEVGRVTVVDHEGKSVIDELVLPKHQIYDYVTKYSGLTPSHMEVAKESVESVREKILNVINEDSILIGHALNGDLKSLGILHSKVIDTSIIFMKNGRRPSLRHLTSLYLKREIQNSEGGHCSREDAVASLQLVYFAAINSEFST